MNKSIFAVAVALTLAACGQNKNEAVAVDSIDKLALHSGLLLDYMNTDVRPGDDFNSYVNGGRIGTAVIPADKPGYGIGTMLNDQSQEDVKAIIEQAAEGDFPQGSDEQKVGDLYFSYMDVATRNTLGTKPIQDEFETIDALENHDQLAVYFAEANKIGFGMPFALLQYVDFKNPNTYMMYTYQGGLGLPDREYYFKDDDRSGEIRTKYVQHVATMLDMTGIADSVAAAGTIIALETRLAADHMKKEDTRDMVALYNKIPVAELPELCRTSTGMLTLAKPV